MKSQERDERIRRALQALQDNPQLSLTQAAREFSVAKSTLSDHKKRHTSRATTRHSNAKLTYHQEAVLGRLIQSSQHQFRPVHYSEVRVLANKMAIENRRSVSPVGKNWVTKFIQRQPDLRSRRELHLEMERVSASNPAIITSWFNAVQSRLAGVTFDASNVWNMDEIGFRHNHHQSEHACFDRRSGLPISIRQGNTSWTSSIECINAAGAALPPLVIHQGEVPEEPLNSWFPPTEQLPNFVWGFTPKGWTSNDYGNKWFEDVFLPATKTDKPRLLYMDGHSSHITGEIQALAFENNVYVVWILSHCSHLIQPLDQQPFAAVKRIYSRKLKEFDPTGISAVSRADFDVIFAQSRSLAFEKGSIESGWKRSGLWPFDVEKVLARYEVRSYRPTTPDLQPPKTVELRTPKRKSEWKPMVTSLRQVVPQSHQLCLTRIERHLDECEAELITLRSELRVHRKQDKQEEDTGVHRRVRKLQDSITTSYEDVLRHRGAEEFEIVERQATMPSAFQIMEGIDTRGRYPSDT